MMRRVIAQPVARRVAASTALVAAKPAASTVAISVQGLHYVGTGLAGVGLGIGTIFGNLLVACARQPNLTKMFALMLAFLMLFS